MKHGAPNLQSPMVTRLFREFFRNEKAGGLLLIACTVASLLLANSGNSAGYVAFWEMPLGTHTLTEWINDGLMAIFFLMIGLELEREIYQGELSSVREAALPGIAALGGMVVPAGIYLLFNRGTPAASGAGIPMATDIAFALAVLSLPGKRVPAALKVFLTALAVIDDLGAILVIALFYSKGLSLLHLGIAGGLFAALLVLNRLKVHNLLPYLVGGVAMWYFMLHSGVHATIAGVLLAFAIPFGDGSETSASYQLQHFLHKPVAFFILPLFALANTAIPITAGLGEALAHSYSIGIAAGLLLGKPIGILLFTALAVRLRLGQLPAGVNWKLLGGAGMLAGIGFTMSVFITLLAFDDHHIINNAKLAILVSSLVAAIVGLGVLMSALRGRQALEEDEDL